VVRKLIEWALNSPLIVLLLVATLAVGGGFAFANVNVEAYPDPAPAIIEVVAQYPGASAEEVERQVTIPLEVTLAGMPGLKYTRSKSLFGLAHLRNQFDYGIDFYRARQEVINRLQFTSQLPPGVNPQISPMTPTGELMRYVLDGPKDALGRDLYALHDLKAIQDWTLVRQFRRVPRIIDVVSFGGTVKRYEIRPDPDRLKWYGITLAQLQNAIASSNANVGGDLLTQGSTALNVRGVGLIGGGEDPVQQLLGTTDPRVAARRLRAAEDGRLREIREIVVASVNNVPIRVEDVVEGGPVRGSLAELPDDGVVIGYQTRLGKFSLSRQRRDADGQLVRDGDGRVLWDDEEEKVQGVVLMRKGEETLPALKGVHEKQAELNQPGQLLPGVQLSTFFDLTGLIHLTTETVRENLLVGMMLVTVILLMFLSNVRSALIVAINIPLALLFAFSVLFLRGKSANLLSIGAVDFGIIVDSSVIMVENIYRHVSAGEHAEMPLKQRIIRASHEIEKGLFFSTAIMICAFIPLFTMEGPEGQIFGPMADTYAFALGGALMLALTVSPVLCLLLFRHLKPARDNFLVRWLKGSYLRQLERCLNHRALTLGLFGVLIAGTAFMLFGMPVLKTAFPEELAGVPTLGREFMPELEEGNLYVRGTFPVNVSLDESADKARRARAIIRAYDEIELVASQVGRPDDGTDPTGYYNVEFNIPLKPEKEWPLVKAEDGWRRWLLGHTRRARTKPELIQEMNAELNRDLPGVDWNFSQYIRDNVMESLSGVKGDNSVKIIGPDLDELERLAERFKNALEQVQGIENVGVFRIKGQANLEFPIDRKKCNRWGVSVADVGNVIKSAVGGQAFTQLIEGEKTFDVTLRWPKRLRDNEQAILNIPVDVTNNIVTAGNTPGLPQTPVSGQAGGVSPVGTSAAMPSPIGTVVGTTINNISNSPRRRLGDLVTPRDDKGRPDPNGSFLRPGASTIYREQGLRLIAVKFSVRGRDLAGAVAEAQQNTAEFLQAPYRAEWSGEFQQMEKAERRLMVIIPISLALIFVLLYLAFRSLLDVFVVLSNVVALSLGGVWALLLTGTNFSISAAVGFISIFGVAIMDGLLSISYFNQLRFQGVPLREAIIEGAGKRVRPMMMTALTAIFGLLPAAVSTRIGAQTQRPLAIVVVGGMIMTLLLNRYLMPVLYSFYGHREPPAEGQGLAH
jgi:cobalt-zinc-cadmium resistance protein CzcA